MKATRLSYQTTKAELSIYLPKAADVNPDIYTLQLWQKHSTELPHWSAAVKDLVFIQPSSAAAEHVFSMLKASFHPQQDSAIQDSVQASLMLQFDKR